MFSSLSPRARRWLWGTALVLASAAAGFGLGILLTGEPVIGCREVDLTVTPDTSFLNASSSSAALPASEAASAASDADSSPEPVPEKRVCLTFDDGPSKTTADVLDALAAENVPATFFVVATDYNEKYLPLIQQAAAQGHQIALHSASHDYSDIYSSSESYWKDLELLCQRILPYVNVADIHFLRFPGGSTNTVSRKYGGSGIMTQLKTEVEENGYHWVDWNVCAEDAAGQKLTASQVYQNVVREVNGQKECIVLMHDSATTHTTAEALPDIIQWFREQGYTFCTVSQLYE